MVFIFVAVALSHEMTIDFVYQYTQRVHCDLFHLNRYELSKPYVERNIIIHQNLNCTPDQNWHASSHFAVRSRTTHSPTRMFSTLFQKIMDPI